MIFAELHEALRLEILRRQKRGDLSGKLLAQLSGLKQPHISNFLRGHSKLSLSALDRLWAASGITAADLIMAAGLGAAEPEKPPPHAVPLVSAHAAMFDRVILPGEVIEQVHPPLGALAAAKPRCSPARRQWQRFVAVRLGARQAASTRPLLRENAIVIIDRHYNSLVPYKPGVATLYAVSHENSLLFRYVRLDGNHLILRPHNIDVPSELLATRPGQLPNQPLVGRAFYSLGEIKQPHEGPG